MSPEEILAVYRRYGIEGGEREVATRTSGVAQAAEQPNPAGSNLPRSSKGDTAVIWKLLPDKTLEPVKISLGITDHAFTQVVGVLKGQLTESDALVIRSVVPKGQTPGTLRR
jgi:hypothetical protein